MAYHWTYDKFKKKDDLFQGDILEPTEKLCAILKKDYPHFNHPKYNAFMIVSQTCDLVIRKSKCNTMYLNIAGICPLETVLQDFLSLICTPIASNVFLRESKGKASSLFSRIFNQNEQSLGLFYLFPEEKAGINVHSVALLRVTIALGAEHYNLLKKARRGRLNTEFRSKLGWLVGNLYSRVGTQDWYDSKEREKELVNLISQFIDDDANIPLAPIWIPKSWVKEAEKNGVNPSQLSRDKIFSVMESFKPKTAKEQAIDRVLDVLIKVMPCIDFERLESIRNRLMNDREFTNAMRRAKHEIDSI